MNSPLSGLITGSFLIILVLSGNTIDSAEPFFKEQNAFESGTEGYHTFRLPSVVVSNRGTVLAFAEAHSLHIFDSGDIDVALKRSLDGGQTWEPLQVVWSEGQNACGGPTSVVDRETGRIWLYMRWNHGADWIPELRMGIGRDSMRAFVCHSDDDGVPWSQPEETTEQVKKPEWRCWLPGPGVGIQLELGRHKGRLVIPCFISAFGRDIGYDSFRNIHDVQSVYNLGSYLVFSDDHGKTWQRGKGVVWPWMTECHVVELANGDLMLNIRQANKKQKVRATAVSSDGGMTWSEPILNEDLVDPYCQGSFIRYTRVDVHDINRLLHSNAADPNHRRNMTVKLSYDEGKAWPVSRVIEPGNSQYSCLTVLPDMTIGLLYEAEPYKYIRFANFNLEWLTDGRDQVSQVPRHGLPELTGGS